MMQTFSKANLKSTNNNSATIYRNGNAAEMTKIKSYKTKDEGRKRRNPTKNITQNEKYLQRTSLKQYDQMNRCGSDSTREPLNINFGEQ